MKNVIALDVIREEKQKYETETEAIQLDQIMKKLFMITNPIPIIDFLNSVHKDNLSYTTKLTYLDKEIINKDEESKRSKFIKFYSDMYIRATDGDRTFEYIIEFQTRYDDKIGIRLFRYSFELAVKQVQVKDLREETVINLSKPYLIMLEEDKRIPDVIKLIIVAYTGDKLTFPCEVLKYWDYSLDNLEKRNLYLLYPLKVIQVREKVEKAKRLSKRLKKKNQILTSYNPLIKEIYDDILNITNDIFEHTKHLFVREKINIAEFNEFGTIIENLCEYLNSEVENILAGAVEEVKKVVKTFIDKELMDKVIAAEAVAKQAKEEAKEAKEVATKEAIEKITFNIVRNMLLEGESLEKISRFTDIEINKIEEIKEKYLH